MNDVPGRAASILHSDSRTPNLVRAFAALSLG
jgi:hypothetical protein